ncbi:unnamed protein product, partial [Amoebophrya sp. A25]
SIEKFTRRLTYPLMTPSYDLSDKKGLGRFLCAYQYFWLRSVLSDLRKKLVFAAVERSAGEVEFFEFDEMIFDPEAHQLRSLDSYKQAPAAGRLNMVQCSKATRHDNVSAFVSMGGSGTTSRDNSSISAPATSTSGGIKKYYCFLRSDLDPEDPLSDKRLNSDLLEEFIATVVSLYRTREVQYHQGAEQQVAVAFLMGEQMQVGGSNPPLGSSSYPLFEPEWLKVLLLKDAIFHNGRSLFLPEEGSTVDHSFAAVQKAVNRAVSALTPGAAKQVFVPWFLTGNKQEQSAPPAAGLSERLWRSLCCEETDWSADLKNKAKGLNNKVDRLGAVSSSTATGSSASSSSSMSEDSVVSMSEQCSRRGSVDEVISAQLVNGGDTGGQQDAPSAPASKSRSSSYTTTYNSSEGCV